MPDPVDPIDNTPMFPDGTPGSVFDLSSWKLTLPVDNARELFYPILGLTEVRPYYRMSDDGSAIIFRAHASGDTTPGTDFARSELREMIDGDEASWSCSSGRHILETEFAVLSLPDEGESLAMVQIHNTSDDVVMVRLNGDELIVESDGDHIVTLDSSYDLGDWVTVGIDVDDGDIRISYNGDQKATHSRNTSNCYFKCGNYIQTDNGGSDNWGEVAFKSCNAMHGN